MRTLHRTGLALAAVAALALVGCVPEPSTNPEPPTSVAETQSSAPASPADQGASVEPSSAPAETTIPAGAVAASADFPFPVPEGWAELEAFFEGRIGASDAMIGVYEFPGAAEDAAALYEGLLNEAGFTAAPFPLGAVANDASITVEGPVAGVYYAGTVDFNTHADGLQKATINLTVD